MLVSILDRVLEILAHSARMELFMLVSQGISSSLSRIRYDDLSDQYKLLGR